MSVIVGFRDTPRGEAAIARAIDEARLRGAPLHILTTVRAPAPRGITRGQPESVWLEPYEAKLGELRGRAEAAGVTQVEVHLIVETRGDGQFLHELNLLVDKVDADLVVIGIRDRSPVGKFVLGSQAQAVLLHVECDVLAVKSPAGA